LLLNPNSASKDTRKTQCSSTGIRNVHLKVPPNEEFPCHDCGIASLSSLRVKYKVRNVSIDRNTSAESKIVNGSRRSGVVGEGEEWFEKSLQCLQCWLWWGRSGEEGQEHSTGGKSWRATLIDRLLVKWEGKDFARKVSFVLIPLAMVFGGEICCLGD
jgi:hypothetical protein